MEDYSEGWPPQEYYLDESRVAREQIDQLRGLVERRAGEKEIDAFITANPVVLTMLLDFYRTGHHGAWVVPKKVIRSRVSTNTPGLIPDFIIGGKSSMGFLWMVVELKGADENVFSKNGDNISLSRTVSRGVCQLLEYIDFCAKSQAYIRDSFKLTDFREPAGLLIVGTESETNQPRKRELKFAWNRIKGNLQIRSYDALLRTCERVYESYHGRQNGA